MKYKTVHINSRSKRMFEYFESNQRTWKEDFTKAFGTAFLDKDVFDSCVRWIEGLLLERDTLWDSNLDEIVNHIKSLLTKMGNRGEV